VRACYANCTTLALRLLAVIASNLGVGRSSGARLRQRTHELPAPELLSDASVESGSEAHERPLGIGEHTDSGALTILMQDDQPGSRCSATAAGTWSSHGPNALVVNIGDIVQVWSNDKYKAGAAPRGKWRTGPGTLQHAVSS